MTAHPTLQHDNVSGHLLVLSMAKLWKGGAAAAAALCHHLSPKVWGAHPSVTTGSARCRHATGSSAASTAQPRARPVTVGAAASCGADVQLVSNWQWLRPRRRLVLRRPNQSARCTFWLECRSRQMAVFCAVSANNCSHGTPIGFATSTSTHLRLL